MKLPMLALAIGVLGTLTLAAQDRPTNTFQLQFRIVESAPQSRPSESSFLLTILDKSRGKLNASRRIPYVTSTRSDAKEIHTAALGAIFDCGIEQRDPGLQFQCAIESSLVASSKGQELVPSGALPLTNSRQVTVGAVIPLNLEVSVAGMDDPSTGNRIQIFITAKRLELPAGAKP